MAARRRVRWQGRVRRATLRDLELLVRHRRRMWEDIDSDLPATPKLLDAADVVYRAWSRRRLRDRTLVGFVAEDPTGRAVGSACVWLQESQPRPWWSGQIMPYILSVYTEPELRGRGIASRATKACVDFARAAGYPRIILHASEQGRSVYTKLGFERTWEMRLPLRPRYPTRGRKGRPTARAAARSSGGRAAPGRPRGRRSASAPRRSRAARR